MINENEYQLVVTEVEPMYDQLKDLCLNDLYGEVMFDLYREATGRSFWSDVRRRTEDMNLFNRLADYVLDLILEYGYDMDLDEVWWMAEPELLYEVEGTWYAYQTFRYGRYEHAWTGCGPSKDEARRSMRLSTL